VRLLTYNIREGGIGRADVIAEVIDAARPDVVALQEARNPAVVERIAQIAGFPYWGSRGLHSTGFLSRVPVIAHELILNAVEQSAQLSRAPLLAPLGEPRAKVENEQPRQPVAE